MSTTALNKSSLMDNEDFREFKEETLDLIDESESLLIKLESNASDSASFSSLCRYLHSIKGTAGMLELKSLEGYIHALETYIQSHHSNYSIDTIFKALDEIRSFLDSPDKNLSASFEKLKSEKSLKSQPIEKAQVNQNHETMKPLIIYLDDDKDMLEIVSGELGESFEFVNFQTSAELIKYCKEEKKRAPDLILADYNLGDGENSLQNVEKTRSIYPHLPFVIVSGFLNHEISTNCLRAKVDAVVDKPLEYDIVLELLKNLTEKYQNLKFAFKSERFLLSLKKKINSSQTFDLSGEILRFLRSNARRDS